MRRRQYQTFEKRCQYWPLRVLANEDRITFYKTRTPVLDDESEKEKLCTIHEVSNRPTYQHFQRIEKRKSKKKRSSRRRKSSREKTPLTANVDMSRKDSSVGYRCNATTGSTRGVVPEEICIYDNPFTSYYPVDGQHSEHFRCLRRKPGIFFYVKDSFCPIRRGCILVICCIFAMIFIAMLLNVTEFCSIKSKYRVQFAWGVR